MQGIGTPISAVLRRPVRLLAAFVLPAVCLASDPAATERFDPPTGVVLIKLDTLRADHPIRPGPRIGSSRSRTPSWPR